MRSILIFLVDVGKWVGILLYFSIWGYLVFLIYWSIKYKNISYALKESIRAVKSADGSTSFKSIMTSLVVYSFIGTILYCAGIFLSLLLRAWQPENSFTTFLTDKVFIFPLDEVLRKKLTNY